MSKFATGKYAKAISDRSGLAFPFQEMVREWNGSFVHKSEYEAKAPQVQPTPHKGEAPAFRNVRRDIIETIRKLEKESEISEDEKRISESKIQIITDEFIREIDDMLAQKEKDIKSV